MQIRERSTTVLLALAAAVTMLGGAGLAGCDLDTRNTYTRSDSTRQDQQGASSLTGPGAPTGVRPPGSR